MNVVLKNKCNNISCRSTIPIFGNRQMLQFYLKISLSFQLLGLLPLLLKCQMSPLLFRNETGESLLFYSPRVISFHNFLFVNSLIMPFYFYFFNSSFSGYDDELAWAALWLYKATSSQTYLDYATLSLRFLKQPGSIIVGLQICRHCVFASTNHWSVCISD